MQSAVTSLFQRLAVRSRAVAVPCGDKVSQSLSMVHLHTSQKMSCALSLQLQQWEWSKERSWLMCNPRSLHWEHRPEGHLCSGSGCPSSSPWVCSRKFRIQTDWYCPMSHHDLELLNKPNRLYGVKCWTLINKHHSHICIFLIHTIRAMVSCGPI